MLCSLFFVVVVVHAGCDKHRFISAAPILKCTIRRHSRCSYSTGHRPTASCSSKSRFLPTLPAFDAPGRGAPSEYCHEVWCGKLEWRGYPTVKIIRFDKVHERQVAQKQYRIELYVYNCGPLKSRIWSIERLHFQ